MMIEENDQEELPSLGIDKLSLFLGALLLGIIIAIVFAPTIFRVIPSDLTRIQVLLDALSATDTEPEFIVFGNSVAQDGLDTRVVSQYLPNTPVGYNFGSPGQSLAESYLYYQDLPALTIRVIQFLSPGVLAAPDMLHDQKYTAFYMYGYRPSENTINKLQTIHGDSASMLDKSYLDLVFDSRWAIRQLVDTNIRNLLRGDLDLDQATYDIYFPSTMSEPISEDKLVRHLSKTYGPGHKQFHYSERQVNQLTAMVNAAKSANRNFTLVLAPINPRAHAYLNEDYLTQARSFFKTFARNQNIQLVNAMDLLSANLFADGLHPTIEGAEVLSQFVGQAIATNTKTGVP